MTRKKRTHKCNNCGEKVSSKNWLKVYQMIEGHAAIRLIFCNPSCLHAGVLNWAEANKIEAEKQAARILEAQRIEQEQQESEVQSVK